MKKYTTAIFLFLTITGLTPLNKVVGQNLIFNGNFEDINYCTERKQPCSPSAWFYIDNIPLGYGKRTELNYRKNYILRFGGFKKHQYWQTILADSLIPGKEYLLSFDLSEGSSGLDNYGFHFAENLFFASSDTFLDARKYISMTGGKEKVLKSGWVHVEKRFIADSSSRYLIVGDFGLLPDEHIAFDLDNIRLTAIDHKYQLDSHLKDSLYASKERHFHKTYYPVSPPPLKRVEKRDSSETIVIDNLQFEFDSYTILNPETLNKFDSVFVPQKIERIIVIGFTDSVGSEKYNLNLSKMRAEAVRKLLISRFGFAEGRIEAIGGGISKEYSDSQKNRRVEIKITRRD